MASIRLAQTCREGRPNIFSKVRKGWERIFSRLPSYAAIFWSSDLFECPCLWKSCLKWRWLLKKSLKHIICFVDILYSFLPTFVIFIMMNLKIESKQRHPWFSASPWISSWWTSSQLACYQYPCRNSLINFRHRFPWQMSSVWVLSFFFGWCAYQPLDDNLTDVHPGRLTWNLRIHPWKRRNIFQTIIFRFYANLGGCIYNMYVYISWMAMILPINRYLGFIPPHLRFHSKTSFQMVKIRRFVQMPSTFIKFSHRNMEIREIIRNYHDREWMTILNHVKWYIYI